MFLLTILLWVIALLAQLGAVMLALMQWSRVGKHRVAWTCVCLALVLMVQRRFAPLEMAMTTGLFDFSAALTGCAVSLLMLAGFFGLRRLLAELAAQRRHLETLAGTDSLTGLFNRRQLFERAHQEILRAQRSGEPLAVLMLDLDHFKPVNDLHGHALGDTLLQALAEALRATLRRIDLAGRIGGEEFVVLLPNSSTEAALAAAERLRLAVAAASVPAVDGPVAVTTSIGLSVADCLSVRDPAEYFRGLLQEADTALYVAKQRGRNRVELWTPEMVIQGS